MKLLDCDLKAEDARYVLPLGINTEFAMTAFISDWKHFFDLRVNGTKGKPHPDINKIATKLKEDFIFEVKLFNEEINEKGESDDEQS